VACLSQTCSYKQQVLFACLSHDFTCRAGNQPPQHIRYLAVCMMCKLLVTNLVAVAMTCKKL